MAKCRLDFWKSVCIQDDLSIRCVQMSTPIAASPLHGFLISGTSLFHGITSMFLSVLLCFAKTENTFGTLKWKRGSAPLALFVHVLVMHELCFARLPASVCRSVARLGPRGNENIFYSLYKIHAYFRQRGPACFLVRWKMKTKLLTKSKTTKRPN